MRERRKLPRAGGAPATGGNAGLGARIRMTLRRPGAMDGAWHGRTRYASWTHGRIRAEDAVHAPSSAAGRHKAHFDRVLKEAVALAAEKEPAATRVRAGQPRRPGDARERSDAQARAVTDNPTARVERGIAVAHEAGAAGPPHRDRIAVLEVAAAGRTRPRSETAPDVAPQVVRIVDVDTVDVPGRRVERDVLRRRGRSGLDCKREHRRRERSR
jgi:hypothetical protein